MTDDDEAEVAMGKCDDGLMHAFKVCSDGTSDFPMCGKATRCIDAGEPDTNMCSACIPLLCDELGIDVDELLSE